jgi:hypothetical protein
MFRLRLARTAAAIAALALAASFRPAASASTPDAPTGNLLKNPGFEESLPGHPWMPAGWDTSTSGLLSVFFGRDTFMVHSGRYAVSIANLSTVYPMSHNWSQSLLVPPSWWGKDAVFSVWTRSNGLQGRAYILALAYQDTIGKMAKIWNVDRDAVGESLDIKKIDDPLLDIGWKRRYFSDTETDWVKREVRVYLPPSTNMLYLRCGLQGTGQVLFDDASVTLEKAEPAATPKPHANLLVDPGFEGDGNDWEYSVPPYEGVRVERDTTLRHSGKACIFMHDSGNGLVQVNTGVCQAVVNRNTGGLRFRASAYMKTDSLQGTAAVMIYFHTLHGTEHPVPKLYSNTNDWTLVTTEADAPKDTYEVWAWYLYQAPAPGRVYFDDCSLESLGPTPKPPKPPAGKPAPKR